MRRCADAPVQGSAELTPRGPGQGLRRVLSFLWALLPVLSFGQLAPITERAIEQLADALAPLVGVFDPRRLREGRVVPDVLSVQARQLGDPVAFVVASEPGHGAVHRSHH